MEDIKVVSKEMYDKPIKGFSLFSYDEVEIIGEQTVIMDNRLLEQFIYNIVGFTPKNGKPFIALKCNIGVR